MEPVIEKALDEVYKDYIFIGRERSADNKKEAIGTIDVGESRNKEDMKAVICELMMASKDDRIKLLDYVLECFKWVDNEDFDEFLEHVKYMKRARLSNARNGRIISYSSRTAR